MPKTGPYQRIKKPYELLQKVVHFTNNQSEVIHFLNIIGRVHEHIKNASAP
jgi:hypothetical protein